MRKLMAAAVAATMSIGMMAASTSDTDAHQRWLRIHNTGSSNLCYVYISHVGTGSWGRDLLGPCVRPGYYVTVDPGYQQGYCMMDMKFVFASGREVVRWEYNICEGTDFYVSN